MPPIQIRNTKEFERLEEIRNEQLRQMEATGQRKPECKTNIANKVKDNDIVSGILGALPRSVSVKFGKITVDLKW